MGDAITPQLIKAGYRWVVGNPVVIFLVLVLLVFNHFFASVSAPMDGGLTGLNMLSVMTQVADKASTVSGFLLSLTAAACASIISMFEAHALLAVYYGGATPVWSGLKRTFRPATAYFYFLYVSAMWGYTWLLLLIAFVLVQKAQLVGLLGGLILGGIVAASFPVLFALLSMATTILALELSRSGCGTAIQRTMTLRNLRRLVGFYLARIGLELVVLGGLIQLLIMAGIGAVDALTVAIIILVLPITILRTSALLLKLDIIFRGETRGLGENQLEVQR